MAMYEWHVLPASEGQRLDDGIRRNLPEVPYPALQSAFNHRDVKLNGKRSKPDVRVHAGDLVQVYCMEQKAEALRIVYEDADVILVDKRAGISIEEETPGDLSLTELVRRWAKVPADGFQPVPCHRLDNQTCGLTLFARNAHAAEVLYAAFRDRTLDKRYLCLVRGQPKPASARCTAFLKKDAAAARVTIHDHQVPGSQRIVTAYETVQAGPVSRLRVELVTGRTHQIRAHLASLGHPLLGDDVYGDHSFNRLQHARRLMLCAHELTIQTNGQLPQLDGRTFTADCPF